MKLENGCTLVIGEYYVDNYADEYQPLYLGGQCLFYLDGKGNERAVSYAYIGKLGIKKKEKKQIPVNG